jgi:tRNA (guanine26-N2/guanine27-N2)-dimethyltransferase
VLAHCHGCGDQQVQSLLALRGWSCCACSPQARPRGDGPPGLAISGPLWIGPLQHPGTLAAMAALADDRCLARDGARLLARLSGDAGVPARVWPMAEIARRLGGGPPKLAVLCDALAADGWQAGASAVMAGQLRTDAPWPRLLALAGQGSGTLDR